MRYYSAGNCYLSSIQQGIQAFHTLGEMITKYHRPEYTVNYLLYDWLHNHKTVICLNGGNNAKLTAFYDFLTSEDNPYPYVRFHEDADSMDSMLTSVAIIVPEPIYLANLTEPDGKLTSWEFELATMLQRMPTAR